jgi:hypothetical protein
MANMRLTAGRPGQEQIRSLHPAPWSVGEEDACFVVRDRNGQALHRVYFKDQQGHTVFTRNEARHLAAALAKLPKLWSNDTRYLAAVLANLPDLLRKH